MLSYSVTVSRFPNEVHVSVGTWPKAAETQDSSGDRFEQCEQNESARTPMLEIAWLKRVEFGQSSRFTFENQHLQDCMSFILRGFLSTRMLLMWCAKVSS